MPKIPVILLVWLIIDKKYLLTARFEFGTKIKIVTANEGLSYIAVYISFIHKYQFSNYSLSKNEFL